MRALGVIVLTAACAAVACGGATTKKVAEPDDAPPDVATDVRGVVEEAYGSLGHGNREGILPLLGEQVYAIGPAAGDPVSGRSDVVVALAKTFPANRTHRIVSHALRAVVSPGGASAYVSDQVDVDGATYAASAVMAQQGGVWVAVAIHVGRVLPSGRQGKDPLPALTASIDPGAKGAADLFARGAARPALFVEQLADGPEVLAIGPGPKELVRGGAAIHKAWKKALARHPALAVTGGVRAGVTPDGQLAWIHADVVRSSDDVDAQPRRALYIYAKDAGEWRLTSVHESALPAGGR
jgi:hypothetical protein